MTVYVCPIRDVACNEYPGAWCEECPLRKSKMSNQSLREAAQQALGVLENIAIANAVEMAMGYHEAMAGHRPERHAQLDAEVEAVKEAAASLRTALSQPDDKAQPVTSEGWLEAAIAWEVCASVHEKWAKGKDALYTTRHNDFVQHAEDARAKYAAVLPLPAEQDGSHYLGHYAKPYEVQIAEKSAEQGVELSDEQIWDLWEFPQNVTNILHSPLSWKDAAILLARKAIAADRAKRGGVA